MPPYAGGSLMNQPGTHLFIQGPKLNFSRHKRGFKNFCGEKKKKMLKKNKIFYKNKTELFIKSLIFVKLFYKKNINV